MTKKIRRNIKKKRKYISNKKKNKSLKNSPNVLKRDILEETTEFNENITI
jgi:hypothetical protein